MRFSLSTHFRSSAFDCFFRGYSTIFIPPNERESLDGFRTCLSYNDTIKYKHEHSAFGPFREFVLILREGKSELPAAGANFVCYPMISDGILSIHSNYAYVLPAFRRRGYLRSMYMQMARIALSYASEFNYRGTKPRVVIFGEQTDPFRMTLKQFNFDAAIANIDSFSRFLVWSRLGARILDFPYIQPPLSYELSSDHTLFLRVIFIDDGLAPNTSGRRRQLSPQLVKEHLRRFFAVSVLKRGSTLDGHPEILLQFSKLDSVIRQREKLSLYDMPSSKIVSDWKLLLEKSTSSGHINSDIVIGTIFNAPSILELIRVKR